MQAGASGIKIWKNIGMVIKDKKGNYVMVDDPVFKCQVFPGQSAISYVFAP
jgi:hypothetical protein